MRFCVFVCSLVLVGGTSWLEVSWEIRNRMVRWWSLYLSLPSVWEVTKILWSSWFNNYGKNASSTDCCCFSFQSQLTSGVCRHSTFDTEPGGNQCDTGRHLANHPSLQTTSHVCEINTSVSQCKNPLNSCLFNDIIPKNYVKNKGVNNNNIFFS